MEACNGAQFLRITNALARKLGLGVLYITSQLSSGKKMCAANLGTVVTNMFLKFPWHTHDGGPQQVTSVYNLEATECGKGGAHS